MPVPPRRSLISSPVILIGRHPECDVRIDSPQVSRRHCCVALAYDRLVIRDLGSRNGVRVNGRLVDEAQLRPGDEVAIAQFLYRLESTHRPSRARPRPLPAPAGDARLGRSSTWTTISSRSTIDRASTCSACRLHASIRAWPSLMNRTTGPVVAVDRDLARSAPRPGRLAKETRSHAPRHPAGPRAGSPSWRRRAATPDAQYYYPYGSGYGGYGFGGWGGTVQGDILRGMGAFAEGEGVYNYDTAVGRLDQRRHRDPAQPVSLQLATRGPAALQRPPGRPAEHRQGPLRRPDQARIRDNPTKEDIDSGDALNVDPRPVDRPEGLSGSGSTLRMADAQDPGRGDPRHPVPRRDRRHHPLARRADRPQELAGPAPGRRLQARARGLSEGRRRRPRRGQGRRDAQARDRRPGPQRRRQALPEGRRRRSPRPSSPTTSRR